MRLQTRYSLIIGSVVLIVVFTMASLLLIQFENENDVGLSATEQAMRSNLYNQIRNEGLSINRVLANNLINPLYSLDTSELNDQLVSVLNLSGVKYAIIYDINGAIVHEGEESISRFGKIPNDPFNKAATASRSPLIQQSATIMDFSHPLFIGDEYLGGVRIGLSLEFANNNIKTTHLELSKIFAEGYQQNLVTVAVTSLLMLVLFGGLLAAWVSRSISLPIRQLVAYASKVGKNAERQSILTIENRHDELGELARSFAHMVNRLEESNKKITYQAHHDPLTNLPNRLLLNDFLDEAIERSAAKSENLTVIFLDIDNFKNINDSLGHTAGDDLLEQFSNRLQKCIREDDFFVARFGGDEFAMLLEGVNNNNEASKVAERILTLSETPFILKGGQEIVVSASIGITHFPKDGTTRPQLLSNADTAMYSSKLMGKNTFTFFTNAMNNKVNQRLVIERDLRQAIKSNLLEVYLQPLFNSRTQQIIGAEALLRWPLANNEYVPADLFIPIAEQSFLIVEIGEWVLQTVCEQLKAWQDLHLATIYCAVNISGVQLGKKHLTSVIKRVLKETALPAKYLHLELTETAILTNESTASSTLSEITALGIDIWMDDFGTGYSSLSLLKKFNVQGVKIDRSFVNDMTQNKNSRAIVLAIIAMAKSLNLHTTAEGVETLEQFALLRDQGCNIIQGYYLGRPMPISDFETLMIEKPQLFSHNTSPRLVKIDNKF